MYWKHLTDGSPHPKSLLRTLLLSKRKGPAPGSSPGGLWEGDHAACLLSTQNPAASGPCHEGGAGERQAASPHSPQAALVRPWTADRQTWRACRGCCGDVGSWHRKRAPPRPGGGGGMRRAWRQAEDQGPLSRHSYGAPGAGTPLNKACSPTAPGEGGGPPCQRSLRQPRPQAAGDGGPLAAAPERGPDVVRTPVPFLTLPRSHPSLGPSSHPSNSCPCSHPINPQPLGAPLWLRGFWDKALVGTGAKRGSEDKLMNPVGRRESLDASHQAQKLQAVLRELLVWARGWAAGGDGCSKCPLPVPRSPTEARRLPGAPGTKGERPAPGPFLESHLLSALSLPVIPTFSRVFFPSPASAFLLFHPTHSCLPPLLLPTGPPPALAASPLGSESSPVTG